MFWSLKRLLSVSWDRDISLNHVWRSTARLKRSDWELICRSLISSVWLQSFLWKTLTDVIRPAATNLSPRAFRKSLSGINSFGSRTFNRGHKVWWTLQIIPANNQIRMLRRHDMMCVCDFTPGFEAEEHDTCMTVFPEECVLSQMFLIHSSGDFIEFIKNIWDIKRIHQWFFIIVDWSTQKNYILTKLSFCLVLVKISHTSWINIQLLDRKRNLRYLISFCVK